MTTNLKEGKTESSTQTLHDQDLLSNSSRERAVIEHKSFSLPNEQPDVLIDGDQIDRFAVREALTPSKVYRRSVAIEGVDYSKLQSTVLDVMSGKGIELSTGQREFLTKWQESKISYLGYIQRRLLSSGNLTPLGDNGSRSQASVFRNMLDIDKAASLRLAETAYNGSKTFTSFVSGAVLSSVKLIKLITELCKSEEFINQNTIISSSLKKWMEEGVIDIVCDYDVKKGVVTLVSPLLRAISELGAKLQEILSGTGVKYSLNSKTDKIDASLRENSKSLIAVALAAFNNVSECASVAFDDETVFKEEILQKWASLRNDVPDFSSEVRNFLEPVIASTLSSDVCAFNKGIVEIKDPNCNASHFEFAIPAARRSQIVPLDPYCGIIAYCYLLGLPEDDTFINMMQITVSDAVKVSSANVKNGSIGSLFSTIDEIDGIGADGDVEKMAVPRLLSDKIVTAFLSIKGSDRLVGKTFQGFAKVREDGFYSNVSLSLPIYPLKMAVKDGVELSDGRRSQFAFNPFFSIAYTLYNDVLGLTSVPDNNGEDIGGKRVKNIFEGRSDISKASADVQRSFADYYSKMDLYFTTLSQGLDSDYKYSYEVFTNARSSFRSLLSRLESVVTTDAAFQSVSSFRTDDPSWVSCLGHKLMAMYKMSLSIGDSSSDVDQKNVVNQFVGMYNEYIHPVSLDIAERGFRSTTPVRKILGEPDVIINRDEVSEAKVYENTIAGKESRSTDKSAWTNSWYYTGEFLTSNIGRVASVSISNMWNDPLFGALVKLNVFKYMIKVSNGNIGIEVNDKLRFVDNFNLPAVVRDQNLQDIRDIERFLLMEYEIYRISMIQFRSIRFLENYDFIYRAAKHLSWYIEQNNLVASDLLGEKWLEEYTQSIDSLAILAKKAMIDPIAINLLDRDFLHSGFLVQGMSASVLTVPQFVFDDNDPSSLLASAMTRATNMVFQTSMKDIRRALDERAQLAEMALGTQNISLHLLDDLKKILAQDESAYSTGISRLIDKTSNNVDLQTLYRVIEQRLEAYEDVLGYFDGITYSSSILVKSSSAFTNRSITVIDTSKDILYPVGSAIAVNTSVDSSSKKNIIEVMLNQVLLQLDTWRSEAGQGLLYSGLTKKIDYHPVVSSLAAYSTSSYNPTLLAFNGELVEINAISKDSLHHKVFDAVGLPYNARLTEEGIVEAATTIYKALTGLSDDSPFEPTKTCRDIFLTQSAKSSTTVGHLMRIKESSIYESDWGYSFRAYYHANVISQLKERCSILYDSDTNMKVGFVNRLRGGVSITAMSEYLSIVDLYRGKVDRKGNNHMFTKGLCNSVDKSILVLMLKNVISVFFPDMITKNRDDHEEGKV